MLIKIMQKGGKEVQQKFLIENWKGKKKKKTHEENTATQMTLQEKMGMKMKIVITHSHLKLLVIEGSML